MASDKKWTPDKLTKSEKVARDLISELAAVKFSVSLSPLAGPVARESTKILLEEGLKSMDFQGKRHQYRMKNDSKYKKEYEESQAAEREKPCRMIDDPNWMYGW